jgi:hypothetical protein
VPDRVGSLLRDYRRQSVTLDVPDALIAATALHYDLILLTYNARHYPMLDVQRYAGMPALTLSGVGLSGDYYGVLRRYHFSRLSGPA